MHAFASAEPDVPRLVVTILDSHGNSPRAVVVYLPDHTKLGKRRALLTKFTIAAHTFDAIVDKLGKTNGAVVERLDLTDQRYARLIGVIVEQCNITGGLVDTTLTITKAAHEFIIAQALRSFLIVLYTIFKRE